MALMVFVHWHWTKRRVILLLVGETTYAYIDDKILVLFRSENMVLFTVNIEYFKLTNEIWGVCTHWVLGRMHLKIKIRKFYLKPRHGFMHLWKFSVCGWYLQNGTWSEIEYLGQTCFTTSLVPRPSYHIRVQPIVLKVLMIMLCCTA